MKKNMGLCDRTVRLVAALAIAILLIAGVLKGTLAVIMGVVAVMFVVTTLISYCPLYTPLKIDTKGKGDPPRTGV